MTAVKTSVQAVNAWKSNTNYAPNRSIAWFISCVCQVNTAEATSEFTQEYQLDDPSCCDTMRPEE